MSNTMIAMLRDEYLAAQGEKKRRRGEIQDRHRDIIAEEIAVMEDAVDKRLGELLVRALESGMKRTEVWKPVFGTNDNKRWTRLVELGGGTVRTKRTGAEIRRDVEKSLGVKQIGENLFEWTSEGEEVITLDFGWLEGAPRVRGVDRKNHRALIAASGGKSAVAIELAAQIASAFGLKVEDGVDVNEWEPHAEDEED